MGLIFMNVIMVLIDSLNKNCIGAYGNQEVKTPNLDEFANKSIVFNNHFISSAPCIPARRELMTGRKEFLWRGWGPIEPFDKHIADEARKAGATTAIITDHYHYWENSAHGYIEHFDSARLIRGQEIDYYNSDFCENVPEWVNSINKYRPDLGTRFYKNIKDFTNEEDFFSAKTMTEASTWLENNHSHEKFLLWVEAFDVHEPFYVPEPYKSMYSKKSDEIYNCWPPYQDGEYGHSKVFWENTTEEEINFIKSQYLGKVSMVDNWLGKLFGTMDKYDLWKDTAVILTTDHGHELGEKKRFGKQPPHYDQSANIPMFIWHPQYMEHRTTDALTCALDIYPTILEILGVESSDSPHGKSLMPLIKNERTGHRDFVYYGEFGAGVTMTDGTFTYHNTWDIDRDINIYTALMPFVSVNAVSGKFIPGVECPVWRIPFSSQKPPIPDLLFNRKEDPEQTNNIVNSNPSLVQKLKRTLADHLDNDGAPAEQYYRLYLR